MIGLSQDHMQAAEQFYTCLVFICFNFLTVVSFYSFYCHLGVQAHSGITRERLDHGSFVKPRYDKMINLGCQLDQ